MADNQFLTVQDVYNPVTTAQAVENLNDTKIRNRLNAMKIREVYQQEKRKNDRLQAAATGTAFNPLTVSQFGTAQPQAPQAPIPQQQAAPMQQPPVQPQPEISAEDKAALRGQKKFAYYTQMIQPLKAQSINDPAVRAKINQLNEIIEKDPDRQALLSKLGFDEYKQTTNEETGETINTLTKNWSKEELEFYSQHVKNPQVLLGLANHPGKYRIGFNDEGYVKNSELVKAGVLTNRNLTREQLINLSLNGTLEERREASAVLDEQDRRARDSKTQASLGDYGLSSNAIDMSAERYLATGKLENYGIGKSGVAIKAKVLDRAAQMAKEQKLGTKDLIANQAELKGNQSALNDLQRREQLIGTFVNRIDATSDVVLDLAKRVNNTNAKMLNVPLNALKGALGSGDLRSLELALTSLSNEIAKVESGSLGIAGVSVDQAKIMAKIHDRNLSLSDLTKVIETGKILGKTSMDSIAKQREDLKNQISGKEPKNIVKTGMYKGRKVVQYSDGSIDYAD